MDRVGHVIGDSPRRRRCEDVATPNRASLDQGMTSATMQQRRPSRVDDDARFTCGMCKRQLIEPRVLACLHAFCLTCLRELASHTEPRSEVSDSPAVIDNASSGHADSSGHSPQCSASDSGQPSEHGHNHAPYHHEHISSTLSCPTCGAQNTLPSDGVSALPPHYVIMRRMAQASLHDGNKQVTCDLCSLTQVPAISHCIACTLSLCHLCATAHSRQRNTDTHEIISLSSARAQCGVLRVRRPVMCVAHATQELRLFCTVCRVVVCRDCCVSAHQAHACDSVTRAALDVTCSVRDALGRAKPVAAQAGVALGKLHQTAERIEMRCNQVAEEVDHFIDSYISAFEEHRLLLQSQVGEARESKLRAVAEKAVGFQRHADDAKMAVAFAEDLLAECSDIELLSLGSPVQRRLDMCYADAAAGGMTKRLESRVSECVQFLAQESAGTINSHTLWGVVTTQTVSPQDTILNTDGLLKCRQYKKTEAILVSRDIDKQPLCHGGERVIAELRYRATPHRRIPVHVTDLRNGTYLLDLTADMPGSLILSVFIQDNPIKGSPYPVCVLTMRAHRGIFHCCSFCSSDGAKEATCGCGGTMPGGYKGCGHGHAGHPGKRHWSCCGNLIDISECGGRSETGHYQYSL